MSTNIHAEQKPLIYQIGKHVKLVDDATFCKSIIADGKELITGKESGEIRVPELNDEKVYITFKKNVTDFSDTFSGCSALKSIPENLFANCPAVTSFQDTFLDCSALKSIPEKLFANNPAVTNFSGTFYGCSALESIPEKLFTNNPAVTSFANTFDGCKALQSIPTGLFDNNRKVTNFRYTFQGCTSLKSIPEKLFANNTKVTNFSYTFKNCSALIGESPYTMIDGQKVHLYERVNYPEHFTTPTSTYHAFGNCTGLTDYAQIPTNWKE